MTPASPGGRSAAAVAAAALSGGASVIQLREKDGERDVIVATGRELRAVCDAYGALLIVNDDVDLALACDADGVHLGQDDEPVAAVRRRVGDRLLIGLSTHTPEQVDAGLAAPADYLGVGPVFRTPTKPSREAAGLGLVTHAARTAHKPFFAIGGIGREQAPAVAAAGARRIAVVRAVCEAPDPSAAARDLIEAISLEAVGGQAR